jgi:hypothetical protein
LARLKAQYLLTYYQFSKTLSNDKNLCNEFIRIYYGDDLLCPKCKSTKVYSRNKKPQIIDCSNKHCKNSFSAFTGTCFERNRIGFRKTLYVIYYFLGARPDERIAEPELAKQLNISKKLLNLLIQRVRKEISKPADIKNKYRRLINENETFS